MPFDLREGFACRQESLTFQEKPLVLRDMGLKAVVQPDRSVPTDAIVPVPEREQFVDPQPGASSDPMVTRLQVAEHPQHREGIGAAVVQESQRFPVG